MQKKSKITKIKLLSTILAIAAIVLIGGYFVVQQLNANTQFTIFQKNHPIEFANTGYLDETDSYTIPGDITIPTSVTKDKYSNGFNMWYDFNKSVLTFQSHEGDDLLIYDFDVYLKHNLVVFTYAYSEDTDSSSKGVTYQQKYKINFAGTKLIRTKNSIEMNYPKKERSNVKKDAEDERDRYEKYFNWVLQHKASYATLKKYGAKIEQKKKTVISKSQSKEKAEKKSEATQEKFSARNKEETLKKSYYANFTDTEWRTFIMKRAELMGLKNSVIGMKTITTSEKVKYFDYFYSGTGTVPESLNQPTETYYTVTSAGKLYFIALPTLIHTKKYMQGESQSWFPKKITPEAFGDYFYNADFPGGSDEMNAKDYVPKGRKPTTAEVVNNIMIVAPDEDSDY